MDIKKWAWPLLALVIALGVVGAWYIVKHQTSQPETGADKFDPTKFDPQHPNFVMGSVVSATQESIEFQSGTENLIAQIGPQTTLNKQVKDAKLVVKVVPATLADFKAKSQIVVYFSADPVNNTYKADKVQIISQ